MHILNLSRTALISCLLGLMGYSEQTQSIAPATSRGYAFTAQGFDPPKGLQPVLGERAMASRDNGYDLRSRRIMSQVILLVKENYVDPSRVRPYDMLWQALKSIERTVPEILVKALPGSTKRATIAVGSVQQEFDLSASALWEVSYRMRDIFEFIQNNIGPHQDLKEIEYAAVNGLLSTLDPHSVLLKPEGSDDMKMATRGEFGGLGISISIRDGVLTVMSPMDETPAARAGIKPLDRIVQIGDESTINMGVDEAVQRLRGKPGTKVTISIMRAGFSEPRKFTLTRAIIKLESVTSELLSNGIGYIKIKSFQGNTFEDVVNHLKKLKQRTAEQGLKGLVLDLRNNPGGLLDQAILISDLFIESGPLVITVGEGDRRREEKSAKSEGTERDLPLAVLIGAGSASASEIVAGAIKNHNRGVLIGEQSFGKGSVQVLYDFKDQSSLKMTIAQYLTPGDISIQSVGVTPDVVLHPGLIEDKNIHLFSQVDFLREKDLDQHLNRQNERKGLTDAPPTRSLNYLYEKTKREQALSEGQEPLAEDEVMELKKFKEDFEIQFAKEMLARTGAPDRKQMLQSAAAFFTEQEALLNDKIVKAFEKLGVNWQSAAAPTAAKSVTAAPAGAMTLSFYLGQSKEKSPKSAPEKSAAAPRPTPAPSLEKPITAANGGETVILHATLRNQDTRPLYRAYAVSQSDNPVFDKREFVFGYLAPGETRSFDVAVKIPKDSLSRVDEVKLTLKEDGGAGNPAAKAPTAQSQSTVRAMLGVTELARPHFAFQWQFVDVKKGNGDGKLNAGEEIELRIGVKNVGRGAAQDVQVNLKNLSQEALYLSEGRAKIGAMAPGETRFVSLAFSLKQGVSAPVESKLFITDNALGEQIVEKFSWNVAMPAKSTPPAAAKPSAVKILSNQTALRAAASESSEILGWAEAGLLFKVDAAQPDYYRIVSDKGARLFFVARSAVEQVSGKIPATQKEVMPLFSHASPDITVVDNISGIHTAAESVTIHGNITSPARLKDFFVFVNDQKVFYQTIKPEKETQLSGQYVDQFEATLPLKAGSNTVTVVARKDQETVGSHSFVLFREGEAGLTPKLGKHQ